MDLLLSPEAALEGLTCAEWFAPGFFKSDFWYNWAYIFALAPQHSVIECRRYLNRFAMYLGEPMLELTMLIHTKYNEYDSVIRPMEAYLEKKGVRFQKGTRVRDIETEQKGKETVATGLVYDDDSGRQRIKLTRDDLVFFTNGSMVQKTTWGDNDTVVSYDRDTSDLGLFDVWKKLAARDPKFGRPEPFISDIEKRFLHLDRDDQGRFEVRERLVRQDGRQPTPDQECLHHDQGRELGAHLLRLREELLPRPARRRERSARLPVVDRQAGRLRQEDRSGVHRQRDPHRDPLSLRAQRGSDQGDPQANISCRWRRCPTSPASSCPAMSLTGPRSFPTAA